MVFIGEIEIMNIINNIKQITDKFFYYEVNEKNSLHNPMIKERFIALLKTLEVFVTVSGVKPSKFLDFIRGIIPLEEIFDAHIAKALQIKYSDVLEEQNFCSNSLDTGIKAEIRDSLYLYNIESSFLTDIKDRLLGKFPENLKLFLDTNTNQQIDLSNFNLANMNFSGIEPGWLEKNFDLDHLKQISKRNEVQVLSLVSLCAILTIVAAPVIIAGTGGGALAGINLYEKARVYITGQRTNLNNESLLEIALIAIPMIPGAYIGGFTSAYILNQAGSKAAEISSSILTAILIYGERKNDGVNLCNINFRGSNLSYADFTNTKLRGANFSGADLTGTKLICVDIRDCNFRGANLKDAIITLNLVSIEFNPENLKSLIKALLTISYRFMSLINNIEEQIKVWLSLHNVKLTDFYSLKIKMRNQEDDSERYIIFSKLSNAHYSNKNRNAILPQEIVKHIGNFMSV